ncbi:MAG TPA: SRPBCC family protein [Euzebyales bacterium]|nr:SRPBCC family protein [Euzebyales bacterium]
MIEFTNTIEIHRPVAEVFAFVSDLGHTPEWNWAISETRKTTEGPVGVGTTYRQTRTVPQHATEELEITALQPDQLLEVTGVLASLPAHLTYRFHTAPQGTRLENTVQLQPAGALRLLAPLTAKRIERSVAENLGVLKNRLEGRA